MDLPGFAADLTLVMRGIIYFTTTYLKYLTLFIFYYYLVFHSRKPKQPVTLNKGI